MRGFELCQAPLTRAFADDFRRGFHAHIKILGRTLSMNVPRTIVVSVTYAGRHISCIRSLRLALLAGSESVVLVCNGVTEEAAQALRTEAEMRGDSLTLVWLDRNVGTEKAFALGVKHALQLEPDFVWMLDDDNLPHPDCLEIALSLQIGQRTVEDPVGPVVSCLRNSDEQHVAIADGASPHSVFLQGGEFFGFDILSRIAGARSIKSLTTNEAAELPQAPYGGLLLPVQIAREVEVRGDDLILYFDDVSMTRALRARGVRIVLSVRSIIDDANTKWVESSNNRYLEGMIRSRNVIRAYYSFRNCLVIDLAHAKKTKRRLRFVLNFAIYSSWVVVASFKMKQPGFLRVYGAACRDAVFGRMGERVRLDGV